MKIGVLGGIGPEATGEFYTKLIRKLQDEKLVSRNKDYPQIIINSIPASEIVLGRASKEELEEYKQGLRELDKLQVDFIVMVCNTIHYYFDEMQSTVEAPILDIRKIMVEEVRKRNAKTVAVLGSETTAAGLYSFAGIKYCNPSVGEQAKLNKAIIVFNTGINKSRQKDVVKRVAENQLRKGADIIILACTEFAVMLEDESYPTVNSINVMVDAVINKCYGGKNEH